MRLGPPSDEGSIAVSEAGEDETYVERIDAAVTVLIRSIVGWIARAYRTTEAEQALVGQHFAYLGERHHQGKLILAGRCQDDQGPGVIIIEAEDETAARAFMENDPAMKAGVFVTQSFHPYRVALLGRR